MSLTVKNKTIGNKNYAGQLIAGSASYLIPDSELQNFRQADNLISDLTLSTPEAAIEENGTEFTGSDAVKILLGDSPKDTENHPIVKTSAFSDSNKFRARFKGIASTATAGQTTKIDHKITEERYINGLRLILVDHHIDDTVDLEIVDKDGAGVALGWYTQAQFDAMGEYVADRFGESWNVDSGVCTQPDVIVPYPAKIYKDLYIRISYNSSGTTAVKVKADLYLHWKAP